MEVLTQKPATVLPERKLLQKHNLHVGITACCARPGHRPNAIWSYSNSSRRAKLRNADTSLRSVRSRWGPGLFHTCVPTRKRHQSHHSPPHLSPAPKVRHIPAYGASHRYPIPPTIISHAHQHNAPVPMDRQHPAGIRAAICLHSASVNSA